MKDTYPSLMDNLPAVLLTDGMPTVARYAREIDAADVHRLRLSNNLIVRPIPEADCDAMICELRPAMDPTGPEVASREARKLVDSYPAREVHNPHAYAAALTGVMAEFPPDILREMRRHLIRHLRYLPVGADVYKVASALMAKRELERVRHRQNQKGDSQGSQKVIQAMSWVKGGQPWMTRPYSEDLRERVVRVVESGTSRNAAAKQFDVSISFVVKLMQRWKQRGTIKADKYGGWEKSKLAPHGDRIRALVMENCDITIDELCVLLAAEGIEAKRSTLGDFLLAQGLSRKKRQPTPPSRSALTSRRREPLGATSNLG